MSKWEKRIAKIRQNPKNVRFEDCEAILLALGYRKRHHGTSHVTFSIPGKYPITIQKPHGSPFVKVESIKSFILPLLEELAEVEED